MSEENDALLDALKVKQPKPEKLSKEIQSLEDELQDYKSQLESAHVYLDELKIPRFYGDKFQGALFNITGRISQLRDSFIGEDDMANPTTTDIVEKRLKKVMSMVQEQFDSNYAMKNPDLVKFLMTSIEYENQLQNQ